MSRIAEMLDIPSRPFVPISIGIAVAHRRNDRNQSRHREVGILARRYWLPEHHFNQFEMRPKALDTIRGHRAKTAIASLRLR